MHVEHHHQRTVADSLPRFAGLVWAAMLALTSGCGESQDDPAPPKDAIVIGAALPFSGPKASTGISLERALMLAIEDVNAAGGVGGRPLYLEVRDSNSGSDRGLDALVQLLRDDRVDYLVGPEEDHLALAVVREVKQNDKLHILPSLSSPRISDSGSSGGWVRLVPSALTMGCALATKVIEDGVQTTRTIAARDDYHLELASVFGSSLSTLGGRAMPTVTVADGQSSYAKQISQAERFDAAEATVMLAYPRTAASIVGDMARSERIRWYFSPMLRDEALLWNVPKGLLSDSVGISPSLSHNDECTLDNVELDEVQTDAGVEAPSTIDCTTTTASRFAKHFAERWEGRRPLETGHFYYDAIVMLALALEAAAEAGDDDPSPHDLLPYFTGVSTGEGEPLPWDALSEGLEHMRDGTPIRYLGAAGEYEFNSHGQNTRAVVGTWQVNDGHEFRTSKSVLCRIPIRHD